MNARLRTSFRERLANKSLTPADLESLVNEFTPKLLAFVHYQVEGPRYRRHYSPEDVLQLIWLRLSSGSERICLPPGATSKDLLNSLKRLVKHRAVDLVRKVKRVVGESSLTRDVPRSPIPHVGESQPLLEEIVSDDQSQDDSELETWLKNILRSKVLSGQKVDLLLKVGMLFWAGYSGVEAAECLGLTESKVCRAKAELEKILKPYQQNPLRDE